MNCLSEDQMLAYLSDTMGEAEGWSVAQHLLTCPLCNDAMEGAKLLGAEEFKKSLDEVKRRIDERLKNP